MSKTGLETSTALPVPANAKQRLTRSLMLRHRARVRGGISSASNQDTSSLSGIFRETVFFCQ